MKETAENRLSATTPKLGSANEFDISKLKVRHAPLTPQPKKPHTYKGWLIAAAASFVAALAWQLYPHIATVQTTAVTMVYPSQQYVLLNATGYVVPQLKAAVASKATGRLEWLGVAEGSHVEKGQVLARLESRDVEALLENARANVRVAQANVETSLAELANADTVLQRLNNLREKGFVAPSLVDDAMARTRKARAAVVSGKAALGAAQASANNAEISVDYTQIRAPFDGVILSKTADIGDVVTPMSSAAESKGAVVTMADLRTLEVEADVSEASLAQINVDQPCVILLDAIPNQQFRGVVSRIVPTVDRAKATVATKVHFIDTDSRILPEMSAKVSFLSQALAADQQQPLMAVSPRAIVERAGKRVVFVIAQDTVTAVEVVVAHPLGDVVAIKGALKVGDLLVLNPNRDLRSGATIAVAKPV